MEKVSNFWNKIRVWFHDSETIAWARIQLFVGIAWETLVVTDLTPFVPPTWLKYMPIWLAISGIITEFSRRAREPHDLGVKTVADLSTVTLPIKVDDKVDVDSVTGTVTVTKVAEIPVAVKEKAEQH